METKNNEDFSVIKKETDEAIDRGSSHADTDWRMVALDCVYKVALEKPEFTMNDVRDLVASSGATTHDNRAMGGISKTAVKNGWIKATGRVIISRVGHKSPLQIWKSLIYKSPSTLF